MKLTIQKQISEEVDLKLPAFFRHHGICYMVKENGDIIKAAPFFYGVTEKGDTYYERELNEVLASESISRVDFDQNFAALLAKASQSLDCKITIEPKVNSI